MELKRLDLREGFTKFELNDFNPETKFHAAIHRFTSPDIIGPHDHPFSFRSFVLKGSYVERVYFGVHGTSRYVKDFTHRSGDSFIVEAKDIHEIIALPEGECITIIVPEPYDKPRNWGFWRFENGTAFFREANNKNWISLVEYERETKDKV